MESFLIVDAWPGVFLYLLSQLLVKGTTVHNKQ